MQCEELGQVIEQNGFTQLPDAARSHVASCPGCAALVDDLQAIVAAARELPAEAEPPARVWVSLRAQLEAEGILRPETAGTVRWWEDFARLLRGRMLATAAVAVLAVAAGVLFIGTPPPQPPASPEPFADTAEAEPPARVWVSLRAQLEAEGILRPETAGTVRWWEEFARLLRGRMLATAAVAVLAVAAGLFLIPGPQPPASPEPFADTASTLDQEERSLGPMQPASLSTLSPVDHSLRENLATVNAFINECHKRLKEDPNDPVARDYLSAAYQQKAEILAAMMERGRSVN